MLAGELYRDSDPELVAERQRAQRLCDEFNRTGPDEEKRRTEVLTKLLGKLGEGSWIMPRFQCDYGYLIEIGHNSFLNYDAILLDCAPITIGDDCSIGPRCQLLTALHPMEDHQKRRDRWESAKSIRIGNNVWFGGGVIVCPGVTIGDDVVVGAGSVVTRDLPDRVFAAGNPARVIRNLSDPIATLGDAVALDANR
ncbi:galactoside O-acetyltransferase [Nocardia camponoti]|uniref:Acetyltransferase n=2 Tax=Nocardia camponoti TaxID=1616106 RepID=A0A917VET8_9NOCA|nr:galactoside O-acetyltransferase [Nocardia camponoti]